MTEDGIAHRIDVVDLPALPRFETGLSLAGAMPSSLLLHTDVPAVGLLDPEGEAVVAMGTARGTVKRLRPDVLQRDEWEVIALEDGDRLVGFDQCSDGADLVFVSSDAQLLRTPAAKVRPQGRTAGGMAGMKLNSGAEALGFWVVEAPIDAIVVTVAAALGALPGTGQTTVKVTPFECYPAKGRGGQGVRCQRFLRGEDRLDIAWVGTRPGRAASADGSPVELPAGGRAPRRLGRADHLRDHVDWLRLPCSRDVTVGWPDCSRPPYHFVERRVGIMLLWVWARPTGRAHTR